MMRLFRFNTKTGRERGLLTVYVLYTLDKHPKSGYDILKEIELKTGKKWVPSKGTLYPLLKKMEKEGLLKGKKGSRSKTIFELSPKGRKVLKEIKKFRKEAREKFDIFKNLFTDIISESEIDKILVEIRDKTYEARNKRKVLNALKKCLSEIERLSK